MDIKGFLTVALMAFAFFFGAGNLIFPPFAGVQAGSSFFSAYFGYILVDVGLSLIAIVAVTLVGRASALTVDLPKWMSIVFWLMIYLVIGPLFAIPRTSVVSYDIGISPFVGNSSSSLPLFIFTLSFFAVTLALVFYPGRIVKIIGGILTPLLLLFLLIIYGVMLFTPHLPAVNSPVHTKSAFGYGLLQGYLTMDTLAALVFGVIISKAVRGLGVSCNKHVVKMTIYTSVLAGLLLSAVYFGLFYMGAISPDMAGVAKNGGQVLTAFVQQHLGLSGQIILALIILLACLTTAVGLVTACAEYFNYLYRRISYQVWAILMCVMSFGLANLGLDRIISLSIPVVVTLYPVTIVLIFAALIRKIIIMNHHLMVVTCCVAFLFSLLDAIHSVDPAMLQHQSWLVNMPLFSQGLGWLLPSAVVFVLGLLVSNIWLRPTSEKSHS